MSPFWTVSPPSVATAVQVLLAGNLQKSLSVGLFRFIAIVYTD